MYISFVGKCGNMWQLVIKYGKLWPHVRTEHKLWLAALL